jgi:hypothetical protein
MAPKRGKTYVVDDAVESKGGKSIAQEPDAKGTAGTKARLFCLERVSGNRSRLLWAGHTTDMKRAASLAGSLRVEVLLVAE